MFHLLFCARCSNCKSISSFIGVSNVLLTNLCFFFKKSKFCFLDFLNEFGRATFSTLFSRQTNRHKAFTELFDEQTNRN